MARGVVAVNGAVQAVSDGLECSGSQVSTSRATSELAWNVPTVEDCTELLTSEKQIYLKPADRHT